jgi:hypothetical protein
VLLSTASRPKVSRTEAESRLCARLVGLMGLVLPLDRVGTLTF